MGRHTVEKIGGTSMSEFGRIMDNVIIGDRCGGDLYNRIFVVSAYGGITNMLLEHKKTGEAGVYQKFAEEDPSWSESLDLVADRMCTINGHFESIGLDIDEANQFVQDRIDGIRNCLRDLRRLCSYGHFQLDEHLPAVREMLSAVGEAHSAFNSVIILKKREVNAVFVDLTGWMEEAQLPFDEKIRTAFEDLHYPSCLPIVTGYTKCQEGIMSTFDRGYSEITFSKIAVITGAREAIIHKEFHLSSGDPKLVGEANVKIIGNTSYDVADQLADLGMEAIHPRASKGLEYTGIALRVKNAFEPDHPGTLITKDYRSDTPRIEMVTGRRNIVAIEVWDPDMVGQSGYDYRVLRFFAEEGISYIGKNTNANTITHYIPAETRGINTVVRQLTEEFPTAEINTYNVSLVSAIGTNIKVPGFLGKAADALAAANINICAMGQCMRQVNMQFVVEQRDFEAAVLALHRGLVETFHG